MSDLNEEMVKTLGRLARIEVSEEELPKLLASLRQILSYFGQLQEVDVSSLSPYSHVEEQGVGSLREDEVKDLLARELFLKNAPDQIGGMIKVPPILIKSNA